MSKHGRRNRKSENRRTIVYSLKTKIIHESRRDPIWAETICQTSHVELRDFGYEQFGEHFSTTFIPEVDNGYILSDSRGRGVFQR